MDGDGSPTREKNRKKNRRDDSGCACSRHRRAVDSRGADRRSVVEDMLV
jgi:hypothetical protein